MLSPVLPFQAGAWIPGKVQVLVLPHDARVNTVDCRGGNRTRDSCVRAKSCYLRNKKGNLHSKSCKIPIKKVTYIVKVAIYTLKKETYVVKVAKKLKKGDLHIFEIEKLHFFRTFSNFFWKIVKTKLSSLTDINLVLWGSLVEDVVLLVFKCKALVTKVSVKRNILSILLSLTTSSYLWPPYLGLFLQYI